MRNVILVSQEKIKSFTEVSDNLEYDKFILPYIKVAQDVNLQQIIGETFLSELYDQVENGNLTTDYRDFISNFCADYIIHYTLYHAYPTIAIQVKNQGIMNNNTETGTSAPLSSVKYIRQHHLELAQFYGERMREHLCNYPDKYPLWVNPDPKDATQPNKNTSSYFMGMALPKGRPYDENNAPNSGENANS
jgi:hypothetical protein